MDLPVGATIVCMLGLVLALTIFATHWLGVGQPQLASAETLSLPRERSNP